MLYYDFNSLEEIEFVWIDGWMVGLMDILMDILMDGWVDMYLPKYQSPMTNLYDIIV